MNVNCTSETCDYVLNSKCVFYEGVALPYAGISTNDSLETALQKLNTTIQNISGGGGDAVWGSITGLIGDQTDLITYINNYTPINRTITINGVTQDLSGNRTWTIPTETFASNVTFVLNSGDSFGKYRNGETASWTGLTAVEAILDAAIDYINPTFTAGISVSGQATTVETGTTLSGAKTFTWTIAANSGVVPTIDIYDVTAGATLLAGTLNDGSQSQTITTIQLNSNGATQVWRGIGNNTSPVSTFNSSNFTVTARYYRWWAPVSATPANSAAVRALSGQAFNTSGNSFTLATGTTLIKFSVNLPPGVTIVSAIDTTNFDVDLTANFVLLGTVNVTDAGGTTRAYNQYEYNVAVPYSSSADIVITTS
jgi:hypothetical protein